MIRFLLWEPKFGIVYLKIYEILQNLFKEKVHAILLKILEVQDRYADLNTIISDFKQLLDEVFVISRIIKVEVRVISRSRRLRLITFTETLIILDITKLFYYTLNEKLGSHVSASSLTASNTSRAKLT